MCQETHILSFLSKKRNLPQAHLRGFSIFKNMENKDRDFKGVWIPKEIWLNTDLSVIEKCLIVEIDSLDNSEKGCFASNEYLGNFIGVKEGTAANMISNLKKRGYISQVFFDGRNRGLRLNKNMKAECKNESSVHEKMKADPTKKCGRANPLLPETFLCL